LSNTGIRKFLCFGALCREPQLAQHPLFFGLRCGYDVAFIFRTRFGSGARLGSGLSNPRTVFIDGTGNGPIGERNRQRSFYFCSLRISRYRHFSCSSLLALLLLLLPFILSEHVRLTQIRLCTSRELDTLLGRFRYFNYISGSIAE
jgi:hypothetical protein